MFLKIVSGQATVWSFFFLSLNQKFSSWTARYAIWIIVPLQRDKI